VKTTALLILTPILLIGGTGCQAISDSLTQPPTHGYERFVYGQNQRETYRSPASEELGVSVEQILYLPLIPVKIFELVEPYWPGGDFGSGPGCLGDFGGIGNIGSIGGP
jgi:hypothetical protein